MEVTTDTKALSLDERIALVRDTFNHDISKPSDYDCWIVDVYDDHVIVREEAQFFRAGYTLANSEVTFEPRDSWVLVEKEWMDIPDDEQITIAYGAVKALGNGRIEILMARYSDEKDTDFVKDFFDAQTDFDLEDGDKVSIYYDHGFDDTLKNRRLGREATHFGDAGPWLEHQLDLADEYEAAIYKLAEMKKLGASSGAAGHLVRREQKGNAYHLTHFPIKEVSLTVRPMDPKNRVLSLKSLAAIPAIPISMLTDSLKAVQTPAPEANSPEASPEAVIAVAPVKATQVDVISSHLDNKEGSTMTDTTVTPPAQDERFTALESQMKGVSDLIGQLMQHLQDTPALKNAGYFTNDGGKADPKVKSTTDFMLAVMRDDAVRLKSVYGSVKALNEDSGIAGGYLVPETLETSIMQAIQFNSPILKLVKIIPVSTRSGKIPVLDFSVVPTAGVGQTGMAAGLIGSRRAEGGAYNARQPKIAQISFEVSSYGDYIPVTNELAADSFVSIEALLLNLISTVVGSNTEYGVLNGNGVGEPLGILNCDSLVTVSAASSNTFAWVDALNIDSKFKAFTERVAWVGHRSTVPDLGRMENGTGGAVLFNNLSVGSAGIPLLGAPFLKSEHMPRADNAKHVGVFDFGMYGLLDRGPTEIKFSEHYLFGDGQVAWRFDKRLDGKPLIKGKITEGDPQSGYETSPFVAFNN